MNESALIRLSATSPNFSCCSCLDLETEPFCTLDVRGDEPFRGGHRIAHCQLVFTLASPSALIGGSGWLFRECSGAYKAVLLTPGRSTLVMPTILCWSLLPQRMGHAGRRVSVPDVWSEYRDITAVGSHAGPYEREYLIIV
jgi:hypothetical protein